MKLKELVYERAVKGTETIKRVPQDDKEGPTLFDYLLELCVKTHKYEYDPKIASPYLLMLWFSHEEDLLPICNKLNRMLFYLPPEKVYDYFWHQIPKGRRWLKWTKKDQVTVDKEKEIENLMNKYDVSKNEATMLHNFLERLNK